MGAFGDIGGVLMGKQGDGKAKTVSSPSINMTVMKVDEEAGACVSLVSQPNIWDFRDTFLLRMIENKFP